MSRLSAAARGFAARLSATGRRRVDLADLRAAFLAAAPDAVGAPDQRERLAAAIRELAAAGRIRLPAGPRSFDRVADPALPRSVLLENDETAGAGATAAAAAFPWRPELAFAAGLRLDEASFAALRRVNDWLRDRSGPPLVVPARERSLDIFGDEKAIDRLAKTVLFGPGRLSHALLLCEPLSPPFVFREVSGAPDLLVVENHDTWHSLATVLTGGGGPIGFVAYGAGKAFGRSVAHAAALPRPVRRILYFGDLDAPGLRIPIRAGRRGVANGLPPIEPAAGLYRLLLRVGRPTPYPYPPAPDEAALLAAWLPRPEQAVVADLLLRGDRIAQEWVGLDLLLAHPVSAWLG